MGEPLGPLVFDDEDRAAAQAERDSIVAPARRSAAAERNARTQVTVDGLPVPSFSVLLRELATPCLNRLRAEGDVPFWFDQLAEPTPLERRAFALLELPIELVPEQRTERTMKTSGATLCFSVWLCGASG